jgi:hypothetical protein
MESARRRAVFRTRFPEETGTVWKVIIDWLPTPGRLPKHTRYDLRTNNKTFYNFDNDF